MTGEREMRRRRKETEASEHRKRQERERETKPYRGALEVCEEIQAETNKMVRAEMRLAALKDELRDITGMGYDEFIAGMRKLLAPAE